MKKFCSNCGREINEGADICVGCGKDLTGKIENINQTTNNNSYFDGGLLSLIGWKLLGALVTICTFGICYPWAFCMVYKWEAKHTVINGRRLYFDGTALGLFGNWIKWLLLTLVTLGIYSLWLTISLKKWKIKHTHFM